MIAYKELVQINKKLSVLIWMNVIAIVVLVGIATIMIVTERYWLILVIILSAIIHLLLTYWVHRQLKRHTKPDPL